MGRPLKFSAALVGRDVAVDGVAYEAERETRYYPGSPAGFEIARIVDEDTGDELDVDAMSDADIDDIQQQAFDVLRIQDGTPVPGQTWRL